MKTARKVIVIVLTILIILTSLISYISGALRLGALNPALYSVVMPALNGYSKSYKNFTEYLLDPLDSMDVPEEIQGVPEDIIKMAIPKKEFGKRVGKAIGGGISWLLYNKEDVEIPIKYFADSLKETIENDERVINSDTNIYATMNAIADQKLGIFVPSDEYEQNFRGYLHYYLTGGNQQHKDYYDYWVDVAFYYYGQRLNIVTIASFVLFIILMFLHALAVSEKRQTTIKIIRRLCLFYGVLNIILAAVLFWTPHIAEWTINISSVSKYVIYAASLLRTMGVLAILYSALMFVLARVLKIQQKKAELNYRNTHTTNEIK